MKCLHYWPVSPGIRQSRIIENRTGTKYRVILDLNEGTITILNMHTKRKYVKKSRGKFSWLCQQAKKELIRRFNVEFDVIVQKRKKE